MTRSLLLVAMIASTRCAIVRAEERVIDARWHHVRNAEPREWDEFPETAAARAYETTFEAKANIGPATLVLRQQDVKRTWTVTLNGERLGTLPIDEIDLVGTFPIPVGGIVDGKNKLVVETRDKTPDDIRIGNVRIADGTPSSVFTGTVSIRVVDASGEPVPARLTILDENGSRAALHVEPSEQFAVRPGVVYSGNGSAEVMLRPGRYEVFAGRGFEFGRERRAIEIVAGETVAVSLSPGREVDTAGWIACDTHVHTLTASGHGDCTLEERMVTLAAEGIELPIATEHNVHTDYGPTAERLGLDGRFTCVIGNEVTTKVGHFNVFPVNPGAPPPDHTPLEWGTIFENVFATPGVRVAILNHARDVHSGVRPFGPDRHVALVGRNLDGWVMRANAMEVVNSSAQQTDVTRLYRDWFGMLNAGIRMTPVGSSDSHDVARHFVGQGRTYIRGDDGDPGRIDIDAAVGAFLEGRVLVSCGLLTTISVDGRFGPGDLVPAKRRHVVVSEVRHPNWIEHDRHVLFQNGRPVATREESEEGTWNIEPPSLEHDSWLVVVASGPGVRHPSWPIAKPYQPDSSAWTPRVLGLTGAVFVDGDGDGRWTSPKEYAQRIVAEADGDPDRVIAGLAGFDTAIASQAAALLHENGLDPLSPAYGKLIRDAAEATRTGFEEYAAAWRESVVAHSEVP